MTPSPRRATPKSRRALAWAVFGIAVMGRLCPAADTNYVSMSGNHVAPFTSWANAATNLVAAIAAATPGNIVLVTNGIYDFSETVTIDKGITVRSVNGPVSTTMRSDGVWRAFFALNHAAALLEGFTITGGYYGWGSGARIESNGGTVRNCIVTGNGAFGTHGGGIYCDTAGLIDGCTITNNSAAWGGGVKLYYGGTISNSIVADNLASEEGGGIHIYAGGTVGNCTIVNNSSDHYAGGVYSGFNGAIENSIVYHNEARIGPNYFGQSNWENDGAPGGWIRFSYCCSDPLILGTGNFTAPPGLVDIASGNYGLLPGSPCIAGGEGGSHVGALPYDGAQKLCNAVPDADSGFVPLTVTFTAPLTGMSGSGAMYQWDFENDGTIDQSGIDLSAPTNTYGTSGVYDVWLAISNGVGDTCEVIRPAAVKVGPTTLYASTNGGHVFPFTSWSAAATNIQSAVLAGVDGSTVLVTNGVYQSSTQIDLREAMTLRSVNGKDVTLIDRGQVLNARCVAVQQLGAVVDGFTLTNAIGHHGGAAYVYGGTIRNCTMVGNDGESGGGAYCDNFGLVENCIAMHNTARIRGAGFYCGYQGRYVNCASLFNDSRDAGGMYFYYGGRADHCTIVSNDADFEAGGIYDWFGGVVSNSIVYGNRLAGSPKDVKRWETVYDTCCIGEIPAGSSGVFTNAPLLVDGFRLSPLSPCIDAADPAGAPTNDFEGEARWDMPAVGSGSIVDVGCDEYRDEDGDGIPDYWEYVYFTNLTACGQATDTDGDGLLGIGEYQHRADPLDADTDDDAMPDGWEADYALLVLADDSQVDGDTDGHDNLSEYIADTDPTNGASVFRAQLAPVGATGAVVLQWPGAAGRRYTVHSATNLPEGLAPDPVLTNLVGQAGVMTWTNETPVRGFHRVSVRLDVE